MADACRPIRDSIPKVGAVISIGETTIGRGSRGTGATGADEHAERNALMSVEDVRQLPRATLYTTLEPCTPELRTHGLECCTELILQHRIQKVFVGMLDRNRGATGKGLYTLQDRGVEVVLYPHDLAQNVWALNAPFIRTQQTLGAIIVSPNNGETLKTYDSGGKHAIRFRCLNPPGTDTHLLSFREGVCWPQPGPFREVEHDVWEIDAHFGSIGDHTLRLVTANDLGRTMIDYYWKVVHLNMAQRKRLARVLKDDQIAMLDGDYPGITMNGLPKGFTPEASIDVTVIAKP